MEAVFIVRLSRRPELVFPGGRVSPLPDALLLDVASSNPGPGINVVSFNDFQNKILGGIVVDRGQMTSFFTTKFLSCDPVLLLSSPEEAMAPVLLPAFVAGFHAFVLAVG